MTANQTSSSAGGPLTVAVSLDIPPYVMDAAAGGFEIELMRRLLPDHTLRWRQMDYQALETAVTEKKVEVSMSVRAEKPGTFYSADYIGFKNFAISKKSESLKIETVGDLKSHPVFTWENAWTELGSVFEKQYAPGASKRPNYIEVADQSQQVERFWKTPGGVVIIDRSIFDYFSQKSGRRPGEATYHNLFPMPTRFKVGFANAALRDLFNTNLRRLCDSGDYAALMKKFHMPEEVGVHLAEVA